MPEDGSGLKRPGFASATTIANVLMTVDTPSVAATANVNAPTLVVVPLRMPFALSVNPAGRPVVFGAETIENAFDAPPPIAARVFENAPPDVTIESTASSLNAMVDTRMEKPRDTQTADASHTLSTKL